LRFIGVGKDAVEFQDEAAEAALAPIGQEVVYVFFSFGSDAVAHQGAFVGGLFVVVVVRPAFAA
jgi:hypothetical protein